jgi:hypothetical protein
MNKVILGVLLFVVSSHVLALTIDSRYPPYNAVPAASGVTGHSIIDFKQAAMVALAGAYRTLNGLSSMPVGTRFTVIYSDGSQQEGTLVCLVGSPCVAPDETTLQLAGGSTAPGGGSGDNGGGSGNGGGGGGAWCCFGGGSWWKVCSEGQCYLVYV